MALNLGSIFYQLGVDSTGLNKADKHVRNFQEKTDKRFQKVEKSAFSLRNALTAIVSAEMVRRTALMANNYQVLGDRIKVVTDNAEQSAHAFKELRDISGQTGFLVTDIASNFTKLQFARKTVQGTTADMLKLTKAFAESALVSGTAPEKLGDAMLQFSQGLVSGVFQAQEFQSVLEAVPSIAEDIAAGMGLTVEELINLKREGKLTSKSVFDALLKQSDAIAEKAAEMPIRLTRGLTRFHLGIQVAVGEIDKMTGLTSDLGKMFFKAGEAAEMIPAALVYTKRELSQIVKENKDLITLVATFTALKTALVAVNISLVTTKYILQSLVIFTSRKNIFLLLAAGAFTFRDELKALVITLGDVGSKILSFFNVSDKLASFFELPADSLLGKTLEKELGALKTFRDRVRALTHVPKHEKEKTAKELKDLISAPFKQKIESEIGKESPMDRFLARYKKTLSGIENEQAGKEGAFSLGKMFSAGNLDLSFMQDIKDQIKAIHNEMNQELADPSGNNAIIVKQDNFFKVMLAKEANYVKKRLDMKNKLNVQEQQQAATGFKNQISAAAEHSKEFFELNKALNTAQIILQTPRAIADAFAFGNSIGGPPVGAAFGTVAGAAMGVQLAAVQSMSFTPRAIGGDVFPNQAYKVNENGPEMFSFGGSDYLMTGSERGRITPAHKTGEMTSTSKTDVIVNVYPLPGERANIKQSQDSQGNSRIDVIMEQVDAQIAQGINQGDSLTSQALAGTFGLNRAAGAVL